MSSGSRGGGGEAPFSGEKLYLKRAKKFYCLTFSFIEQVTLALLITEK